jgi:amino acid transporter
MSQRNMRKLNTVDSIAFTIGSMVGAGIFAIFAITVKIAGPAAVFSWVLVVVFSLPMAYTFSDLTGLLSESGGPYVYIRDHVGKRVGTLVGWAFFLSAVGAAAALYIALRGMLREMGTPDYGMISILVISVLTVVIGRGIGLGALLSRILTALTIMLLLFCTGLGFAKALTGTMPFVPLTTPELAYHTIFPHGIGGVLPATFFAFWTYSGWEAVSVPANAYHSRSVLARGMLIGSLLVGVLYILVATSAILSVPTGQLANKMNPLVLVGALWNPAFANIIAWGAIPVVVGSFLSWGVASSSLLQALLRDRMIPGPARLKQFSGEYHPLIPYIIAAVVIGLSYLPVFSVAIAMSSMMALIAYFVVFSAVLATRQSNWTGVIRRHAVRRLLAGMALLMTIALMVFSGWQNIWPSVALLLIGVVVTEVVRRQRK